MRDSSDDDVFCGESTQRSRQFALIFRSAAFKTFLTKHSIGCDASGTSLIQPQSDTRFGLGVHAGGCGIPGGVFVLPYTGVFAPHAEDDTRASRNISLQPLASTDRDMMVDWRVFDGRTGRKSDENMGYIRGWDAPTTWTKMGAIANHRCMHPNAGYVVVELYVFFDTPDEEEPWIIYASEDARTKRVIGREINQKGEMIRRVNKHMPPLIPTSTSGDVYLINWPVIKTWQSVPPGDCITVDYGDNYVAISPHYDTSNIFEPDDDDSRAYVWGLLPRWNNALLENHAAGVMGEKIYCRCDDCLKISRVTMRSIFLPH
jgi:hypothetical protein